MKLLADHDVIMLDLDGVVYRGARAVDHAVPALNSAQAEGIRTVFVTNNAARTPDEVAEHLAQLGVACTAEDVVTSAQVGAEMLAARLSPGDTVLAVGGPGVAAALTQQGFAPVPAGEIAEGDELRIAHAVRGVLQGYGPDVSWRHLAVASYAVAAGAVWVATNTDQTIPRAGGIAPGNGTLVAAVSTATGVTPPSAGKPSPNMMRIAARRTGARAPLMVGDRLDTDIAGADAAGMDSLLVLTGVSGLADLLTCPAPQRPTYVAIDLRGLHQPLVRLAGAEPRIPESVDGPAPDVAAGIVAAVWQDQDSGSDRIDLRHAERLLRVAIGLEADR